jgi:hypothetical protein
MEKVEKEAGGSPKANEAGVCTAILAPKKEIRGVGRCSSCFGLSLHCGFSSEDGDGRSPSVFKLLKLALQF